MNWKVWSLGAVIVAAWLVAFLQFREPKEPLQDGRGLRNDLAASARGKLLGRDFAGLEKDLNDVWRKKAEMPDGTWQMAIYFEGLSRPAANNPNAWDELDGALREWQEAFPASTPAQIAQGGFLRNRAMSERRNWGNASGPQLAQLRVGFNEKIDQAKQLTEQALAAKPLWPEAYRLRMEVAAVDGSTFEQRKNLLKTAAEAEPSYYDYYYALLWAYNPERKDGSPDKQTMSQYADWCRSIAGGEGKRVYAKVAAAASRFYGDDFFGASGIQWRAVREGFQDLTGKYPLSIRLKSQLCRFACLAGDKKLAKQLFESIGATADGDVWRGGEFERWRTWAGVK